MQTVQEIHNCSSVIDTAESGMRRTKEHSKLRLLLFSAAACCFLMTVFLAQVAHAQQSAAKPADSQKTGSAKVGPVGRSATGEEADETPKPGKPSGEGIKIHGHWVLQVKNPDGTLGERREFNNSLVTGGAGISGDQTLAAILSGNGVVGDMGIGLVTNYPSTGGDPSMICFPKPSLPVPAGTPACFGMVTSANSVLSGAAQAFASAQTGVTNNVSFSPNVNIVLSGNFTVLPSYGMTSLSSVETVTALCVNNTDPFGEFGGSGERFQGASNQFAQQTLSPSSCNTSGAQPATTHQEWLVGVLTFTNIPGGPLTVIANQIVTVTVTITFS